MSGDHSPSPDKLDGCKQAIFTPEMDYQLNIGRIIAGYAPRNRTIK